MQKISFKLKLLEYILLFTNLNDKKTSMNYIFL